MKDVHTMVIYLPFRFSGTLVPDHPDVTNLANTRFSEELVDFFFLRLEMDTSD